MPAPTPTPLTIDPRRAAVLVIDMQNAFVDEQGSLAKMGVPVGRNVRPIPHILRLATRARELRVPVVHLRFVLRSDFADIGILGCVQPPLAALGHCAEGSWDADFVPALRPQPGDFVVDKHRFSGFYGTKLESTLRCLGVDTLVVTGVATNVCVECTVRDAFHRDFLVVVPREGTSSYSEPMEAGSLANFEFMYARVAPMDEVIAAFG